MRKVERKGKEKNKLNKSQLRSTENIQTTVKRKRKNTLNMARSKIMQKKPTREKIYLCKKYKEFEKGTN